ncbi:4838_t:CDS:2, partial [Dentiscutata erythropus]
DSDTDLESNSNENEMAISYNNSIIGEKVIASQNSWNKKEKWHLENDDYNYDKFLSQEDDKLYKDLFLANSFIENLSQESSNQASSSYTLIEDMDHESLMSVNS